MSVSFKKTRPGRFNRMLFLFILGFSFTGINLLGVLDPLVSINRIVVVLTVFEHHVLLFSIFLIFIVMISLILRRFWCWKLCPLGALFDWISILKDRKKRTNEFTDTGRRKALITLASGLTGGVLLKGTGLLRASTNTLLRPPGALTDSRFIEQCIRCGSCVGVCPTNCLRPALMESGIEGILTPKLVPRFGECDEFCNNCGQACPTGAIEALPIERKRNYKIGTARIDRKLCIAWEHNKLCMVCQEHCPYLAIEIRKNDNGIPCPVMVPEICRGCGQCEKTCPARPQKAIRVFNDGAGTFIK